MGSILSAPVDSIVVERAGCSQLRAAVGTLQGWRCNHEDTHVMAQAPDKSSHVPYLFSVMDGHGGDEAAKEMHHLLPQFIDVKTLPKVSSNKLASTVMSRFIAADKTLRDKLPEGCTAGTTCTSALISKHETDPNAWDVSLANAGDSRSIVIHADGSFTATEDHKPDNEKETERIERAGGCVSAASIGPARVDNDLAVSRAFGDFSYKDINAQAEDQKVSCVPDVTHVVAKTGDLVFLACDGIFDVMSNEEVVEFITKYDDHSDLARLIVALLDHVLEKGSKDNCSAMIVDLSPQQGPGDEKSSENGGAGEAGGGEGKQHKLEETDGMQYTTSVDPSRWDGWHTGYWTRQLVVGKLPDDESVREQFKLFHASFGFPDPLPEPCSHCERIFMGMQVCSRCKQDIYCSTYCQKKDWKAKHKEKCLKSNEDKPMNSPKDKGSADKGKKKK